MVDNGFVDYRHWRNHRRLGLTPGNPETPGFPPQLLLDLGLDIQPSLGWAGPDQTKTDTDDLSRRGVGARVGSEGSWSRRELGAKVVGAEVGVE